MLVVFPKLDVVGLTLAVFPKLEMVELPLTVFPKLDVVGLEDMGKESKKHVRSI
jgi:hypothetical protein